MAKKSTEQTEGGAIAESDIPPVPRYRIEEDALIDTHYVEAGTEVDTLTEPGSHWTPLNEAAEEAVASAQAKERARQQANSRASLQQKLAESILERPA